jgi:predicted TPR repeat methyltransferase
MGTWARQPLPATFRERTMSKGREFLDRIYALEEDGDVRSFYDDAARRYDDILLSDIGYVSPTICARAVAATLPDREAVLIDLGCGTGLAGEALSSLGFRNIDGVDFSTEMLAVAQTRNCYSKLGIADLNADLDIRRSTRPFGSSSRVDWCVSPSTSVPSTITGSATRSKR